MTVAETAPCLANKAPTASGLIVDFPTQNGTNQFKTFKSVQFSKTSQLRVFRRPTSSENKMMSYCKKDYVQFSLIRNKDIMICSEILANKGAGKLSSKDMCYFTGLETFLSPNVPKRMRKIKMAREMHVKAVLDEQECQRDMNICSEEAIARVSKKNSYTNRARAYKLAVAAATV